MILVSLLALMSPTPALAQTVSGVDPLFGPELVFRGKGGSDDMFNQRAWSSIESAQTIADVKRFIDELKKVCEVRPEECRFPNPKRKNRFQLGELIFLVSTDPTVIEFTLDEPVPVSVWRKHRELIQKYIYDVALASGAKPAKKFANGMHLNFDVLTLTGNDRLHLRNFIVDFLNHTEIPTGALLEDGFNAKLNLEEAGARANFIELVQKFDEGEVDTPEFLDTFKRIFEKYKEHQRFALSVKTWGDPPVFRFEIRSVRQVDTAEQTEKLVDLFVARMNTLRQLKTRIPLSTELKVYGQVYADGLFGRISRYMNFSGHAVDQGVLRFAEYVYESGLNFDDYVFVLKSEWKKRAIALAPQLRELRLTIDTRLCRDVIAPAAPR